MLMLVSRGRFAGLLVAFVLGLLVGTAGLLAFAENQWNDIWLFFTFLASPLVIAFMLSGRTPSQSQFIAFGFVAVLGLFPAALGWDFQSEREHPTILFAIVTAPFFRLLIIPVWLAAWLRSSSFAA